MVGRVYLVGAGPWDPGLLTLRGKRLLQGADTVIYDYLVNPALLEHVAPDACTLSVGRGPERLTQPEICRRMIDAARSGHSVVRLKGGDPFVFGRGGEEAEAMVAAGVILLAVIMVTYKPF